MNVSVSASTIGSVGSPALGALTTLRMRDWAVKAGVKLLLSLVSAGFGTIFSFISTLSGSGDRVNVLLSGRMRIALSSFRLLESNCSFPLSLGNTRS